jgi:hypothetical protein
MFSRAEPEINTPSRPGLRDLLPFRIAFGTASSKVVTQQRNSMKTLESTVEEAFDLLATIELSPNDDEEIELLDLLYGEMIPTHS